jgi:hypothetical protein
MQENSKKPPMGQLQMPTVFSNVFCLFAAEGGATPTKYQIWNYCGHLQLPHRGRTSTFKGNSPKN